MPLSSETNELPYNPSDVNIRRQTFSVGHINEMIKHQDIDLWRGPAYQRMGNQWSDFQRSRLIESLIMRIPLPIFYLDGSEERWKIIDGLQRLTTFYEFLNGQSFVLRDMEYLKELEDKTYFTMPFSFQRVIESAQIEAYIINPGTPDKVKLNIFQRINTGGKSLTRQEIRNAYYRDQPFEFINGLATNVNFLKVTNNKIPTIRSRDREVALRLFSFYKYLEAYQPPMERFLDLAMESIAKCSALELDDIYRRVDRSLEACWKIFENKAFFILNFSGEKLGQTMNVALLETWVVNLARLDDSSLDQVVAKQRRVLSLLIELFQDLEFHKSISSATSSRKAVGVRFSFIQDLIKRILHAD